jgi:hypothetical protein
MTPSISSAEGPPSWLWYLMPEGEWFPVLVALAATFVAVKLGYRVFRKKWRAEEKLP